MRSAIPFFSVFFFSLSTVVACGGDVGAQTDAGDDSATPDAGDPSEAAVDAAPDVDNGQPSTTYPAFKVDPPQVVSGGGKVLATPNVIPVYFSNDDSTFTDSISGFLTKLTTSTYWGPALTEYGVGAISVGTPVQLNEAAPTSIGDSAIQTWLASKIGDNTLPAPDGNTIFALFYPTGTAITLGQGGGTSCTDFGGYHSNIGTGTSSVAYAVIPRCGKFGGLTGLDAVSATTSHELVEASTDPYPQSNVAYGQVDDNHIIWEFVLGGGETGDMCAQSQNSYYAPLDLGTTVARTWSNISAKAGHDPCQPSDTTAYFNSVPLLTENVTVAGQITTKGITIAVGDTKTVEIDLFSDKATSGPWSVSAIDSATLQGQSPELSFAWDRTTGTNGEKLHLSITVNKASSYGAEAFLLKSTLGSRTNLWVGLISN